MIEHQHAIPHIVQDDVLDADLLRILEEAIDPSHKQEWHKLKRVNPVLANALLYEAFKQSPSADDQAKLLAFGTHIVEIINIALLREQVASVGDDASDQRP